MSPYLRLIIIKDDKTEGPGHQDRLAVDVTISEDNNNKR